MSDRSAIVDWLVGEARVSGDPAAIAEGFCRRLVAAGVPLLRARFAQSTANPLLVAWGVIWTPSAGATPYTIDFETLGTAAWFGSPFQHVTERREPFRRRLLHLHPATDHPVLHEMAALGGTDYLAVPVVYGNDIRQVWSFVALGEAGFSDAAVALIASLVDALAAAFEPIAMRRSTASLLEAYLGRGPASGVLAGRHRRGDYTLIEAAILLTDLRGFTARSEEEGIEATLAVLGRYFDAVVGAVHGQAGDVLKFIGDAVLAIFPTEAAGASAACHAALDAVTEARARLDPEIAFVSVLHLGELAYGNIGSPDRLDFTVVGAAVNRCARLEGLAKAMGEEVVASAEFVAAAGVAATALGMHAVRGVAEPIAVYRPATGVGTGPDVN